MRRRIPWSEAFERIFRNVVALSDPPLLDPPEGRSLTLAEAKNLLSAAKGDRLDALYAVTLTYGLRRVKPSASHGAMWTSTRNCCTCDIT
jgi:hypothetical protein